MPRVPVRLALAERRPLPICGNDKVTRITRKTAGDNKRPFTYAWLRANLQTRLGASGCDVWTLARIAGHSSIGISARYVHPSEDAVLTAMLRLGGHNSGHNQELPKHDAGS